MQCQLVTEVVDCSRASRRPGTAAREGTKLVVVSVLKQDLPIDLGRFTTNHQLVRPH